MINTSMPATERNCKAHLGSLKFIYTITGIYLCHAQSLANKLFYIIILDPNSIVTRGCSQGYCVVLLMFPQALLMWPATLLGMVGPMSGLSWARNASSQLRHRVVKDWHHTRMYMYVHVNNLAHNTHTLH